MTVAVVARLVHHATIFEMNVESYRRRAALERKRGRGRPLGEATLDVSGTFPGEAIRLPIQIAALQARPPTRSKPPGLRSAGSRMRCVVVPRQRRTCTPRGSAKRLMPVYEWRWALTSVLSRTPRFSRWGCGFATARRRGGRW